MPSSQVLYQSTMISYTASCFLSVGTPDEPDQLWRDVFASEHGITSL